LTLVDLEVIEGSIEGLDLLDKNHELIFITSRHISNKEQTHAFFKKYFPNKEFKIIFSGDAWGNAKSKAEICVEEGCDLMIEDNHKYALSCAEKGIKSILIEKPWNKEKEDNENIIRVKDWKEILEKVEELNLKKNIIEEIREFVYEECKKPTSKYGFEPYEGHFVSMVNWALKLAKMEEIDLELIEIAAWLHDIGSIIYGRKDHHITGAKIAREKLKEFNYDEEKIKLVERCILNHRGSQENNFESQEERVIAEADALSNFDNLSGVFAAAFVYEGMNQFEANKSVLKKLKNKWNQLSPKSQELVRHKYEAAKLLLGDENEQTG
jgi:uncharacterized protein